MAQPLAVTVAQMERVSARDITPPVDRLALWRMLCEAFLAGAEFGGMNVKHRDVSERANNEAESYASNKTATIVAAEIGFSSCRPSRAEIAEIKASIKTSREPINQDCDSCAHKNVAVESEPCVSCRVKPDGDSLTNWSPAS